VQQATRWADTLVRPYMAWHWVVRRAVGEGGRGRLESRPQARKPAPQEKPTPQDQAADKNANITSDACSTVGMVKAHKPSAAKTGGVARKTACSTRTSGVARRTACSTRTSGVARKTACSTERTVCKPGGLLHGGAVGAASYTLGGHPGQPLHGAASG